LLAIIDIHILIPTSVQTRNQYASPPRQCKTGRPLEEGRRHGFENGGDIFASGASERSEQKNFFDPPHFLASEGGQNIAVISLSTGRQWENS